MQPIVNGLEEEYSDSVAFRYLNANTDGAVAFEQLGLRGHPAFVIFLPDGREVSRSVGLQDEISLRNMIDGIYD
ncbi:hypothetical protein G4Y79_01660 [Phototrophicus methaneseepsis]|uniref:Thioredoxin domain-containing protein n=1 Tax=Phototrophicus methaneseepsis TaxID=2710758 RepID=A0A7S8EA92_9CHLR|nr:thioredoxin family protein [Phototrophicus methaneseepsis]QPC83108.1 hypothetical protein G4Y79_01660 [Phototrophicus methaneseepsis]